MPNKSRFKCPNCGENFIWVDLENGTIQVECSKCDEFILMKGIVIPKERG